MRSGPDRTPNSLEPAHNTPPVYEYAVYCRTCVWCAGPYRSRESAEEWAFRHEVKTEGHQMEIRALRVIQHLSPNGPRSIWG